MATALWQGRAVNTIAEPQPKEVWTFPELRAAYTSSWPTAASSWRACQIPRGSSRCTSRILRPRGRPRACSGQPACKQRSEHANTVHGTKQGSRETQEVNRETRVFERGHSGESGGKSVTHLLWHIARLELLVRVLCATNGEFCGCRLEVHHIHAHRLSFHLFVSAAATANRVRPE